MGLDLLSESCSLFSVTRVIVPVSRLDVTFQIPGTDNAVATASVKDRAIVVKGESVDTETMSAW
jgi:hypothetical protein